MIVRKEFWRVINPHGSTRLGAENRGEEDSDPRDWTWRVSGLRKKAEGNRTLSLCEFSTLLPLIRSRFHRAPARLTVQPGTAQGPDQANVEFSHFQWSVDRLQRDPEHIMC
jgi:hypothetical protein